MVEQECKMPELNQELNRSDFYSFDLKVSSLSSYLLMTHKKNQLTLLIHNILHASWRNTSRL